MNKKDALVLLQKFRDSGAHLLIPTTQHVENLSDQFEIIVESVTLSGHPKDRDVYPHESGAYNYEANDWKNPKAAMAQKVRLTKHGLEKLNILAGIMWSPTMCREVRDPNIPGRIAHEAVGGVRKPDGTPYFISKIYAMDIEVERQKLESQYAGKQNKDYLVTRDLLQKKSNIAQLCESGAKNRVTREILNLKNFYTVAEMGKEFVMARIVPKLDLKDEYTRRRLIDIQLQALTGIYGAGTMPPPQAIEYAAPIDIKLIEESAGEEEEQPPADKKTDEPPTPDPAPAPPQLTPKEVQLLDFDNADINTQNAAITHTAFGVKYSVGDYLNRSGVKTLDDLSKEKRRGLFEHLLGLEKSDVPY